jgi:hypothetical protein
MIHKVERHSISSPATIERRFSDLLPILDVIHDSLRQGSTITLGTALDDTRQAFIRALCLQKEREVVLDFLRYYQRTALGNFRVGAGNSPYVSKFREEEFRFDPERKTAFMSVDYWEDAYDACLLMRDMAGLKFLATVDESVFAESNNGTTPHDLSYYRFLAHFFNGGKDTGKLLLNAFEEAMKPQSNPVRTKFVELVRIPILDLMQAIVEGDNAKFNDYLVEALEGHKKYYGTKDNAMATPGWLSMRILATCAMAVDAKGFAIDVESDYIPRWLYMGEGIK